MSQPDRASDISSQRAHSIEARAADNLRYIRDTIQAVQTFTLVPGRGCVLMGVVAGLAPVLEGLPVFTGQWLPLWLAAAVIAAAIGLFEMAEKARREGISLRRTAAVRFFMVIAPAFSIGAILTAALFDSVPRDVIAGIWLLSYGAGLSASGVFSIPAVLIAGGSFIGLGAVTLVAPPSWAVALLGAGFGGIHIALGLIVMRRHGG